MTRVPFQSLVTTGPVAGASPFSAMTRKLEIKIPRNHDRRRLYLGFLYASINGIAAVGTGKEVVIGIGFDEGGQSMRFGWTDNGIPISGRPDILNNGGDIVPPFGVEVFPTATSPTFSTTSAPVADEMAAMAIETTSADTFLVRMAPIPHECDSETVVCTVDFDSPSSADDWFQLWVGIRADPN
jgi:hypothetical protein